MSAFNKFNQFVEDVAHKVHDLETDTLKLLLTNTLPVAANAIRGDLTELGAGNGYTSGGATLTVGSSGQTAGVYKLVITDAAPAFTASGGSIGPFQYAVLYNDTPAGPVDPLIGWYDYGSALTLLDGETLDADFDDSGGVITIT